MVKTLIFDFDGTIANTRAFAYHVYTKVTEQHNIKQLTEEEFDHLKTLSLMDKFRAHDVSLFKLPKIARRTRSAISHVMHEIEPFDGMIELLKSLKSKGYQLFIVSSNSENNIRVFTDQYDVNVFDKIYGRAKYLKKEKILKKLLRTYDLTTDDVLYIGDETRDIVSCHRMNMRIVSVSWGFDDKDMLINEKPEFIADHVDILEKILLEN